MNLQRWSGEKPTTLTELFAFYHDYVKVLYSLVQTEGALPQEMLFEINAALDHLSRVWIYGEPEQEAIGKAFGHFKRSCLDVFKILVKEAGNQYRELRAIDTSTLDNGDFDRDLHQLWRDIKTGSAEARQLEGQPDGDHVPAFEKWEDVAENCLRLQSDFLFHERIEWAKRRAAAETWAQRLQRWADGALLTGVIYALIMPDRLTMNFGLFLAGIWFLVFLIAPTRRTRVALWLAWLSEKLSQRLSQT